MALAVLTAAATGCSAAGAQLGARPAPHPRPSRLAARTRSPESATTVLTGGSADTLTADVARQLFASAPVVVVANENGPAALAAAGEARQIHAPLLLTQAKPGAGPSGTPGPRPSQPLAATRPAASPAIPAQAIPAQATAAQATAAQAWAQTPMPVPAPTTGPEPADVTVGPALRAEVDRLRPRAVLAVGLDAGSLAAGLPGIHVVSGPAALPATTDPAAPLDQVAVLLPRSSTPAAAAVTVTAQVAGATVVPVRGADPRTDPAAIADLSAVRPRHILAVGSGFGSPSRLAARVAVAATGVQLPGGGQVIFPGHRLVALYGHPGAPALGVLGQQDLADSIARARKVAAQYRALSRVPVVPTFEIIATVALGSPGPEGTYSAVSSVASLRPWVEQATAAGFYVVLDLQPGRANLLDQAKLYEPLLRLPNVGLALDSEWKLQPGQLPLRQIGSVGIGEINSVVTWLGGLTARYHLPQKLLVLHQFRLSMIHGEQDLDTRYDDLAIVVHMDGQGTPGVKEETWNAVTLAAPPGVFFGWKNFYTKDHPMLSPQATMTNVPTPVMISYQ